MLKRETESSFVYIDVKRRTKKKEFFTQINILINWTKISQTLNKKIKRAGSDAYGRPAHHPIVLFKMMLIQTWYKLSDEGVEEMINDSLSANEFCGLKIEDQVPDHSTLSRFRKELTEVGLMDTLLNKINRQLKKQGLILTDGVAMVDATLTESPWKDRIPTYEITVDREEDEGSKEETQIESSILKMTRVYKKGSDIEARWLKKGKKTIYGYKQHVASDKNGMILGVHTVAANEYEGQGLEPLIEKVKARNTIKEVYTDKGYTSKLNEEMLKGHKIKSRLQKKAKVNKGLSIWEKRFNKLISKSRYVIERTFGSCKKWFRGGVARYKGILKVHAQHIIQSIAYNLKRAPGIIMSKCE